LTDQQIKDNRSMKEFALDTLETVICNFMISLQGIEPENITKQLSEDSNHIFWILGHCTSHIDIVFGLHCQGKGLLSEEQHKHFSYGIAKEIAHTKPAISYYDFMELFLKITENTFDYLEKLPEEKFRDLPQNLGEKSFKESIFMCVQRVALHLMGHMGQITIIRRKLGNPVSMGFVAGMKRESRNSINDKYIKWWNENKEKFI